MHEPLNVKPGDAVAIVQHLQTPVRGTVAKVTPTGIVKLDGGQAFGPDGRAKGDHWTFSRPRIVRWEDLGPDDRRRYARERLARLLDRTLKADLATIEAACEHLEYLLRGAKGEGDDGP